MTPAPLDKSADDRALVDAARSGDSTAFRTIVARYELAVAAVVIGMLGPGDEADDVGQEVFIRFYRALDSYRGEASLKTYLSRIAMNLSLNAIKRRRRLRDRFVRRNELIAADEPATEDASMDAETNERIQAVRSAVSRLGEKHRPVVVLRMIEGYSTRETAEILEIPEGTVMSRLARGMAELRDPLQPYA